mmetsp:Transcript_7022/g.20972  ORF Transcript_7022/g.20972 Transcript_7022/m.20972 type:complete len:233 (-) Transcript_7022:705-1403(-)
MQAKHTDPCKRSGGQVPGGRSFWPALGPYTAFPATARGDPRLRRVHVKIGDGHRWSGLRRHLRPESSNSARYMSRSQRVHLAGDGHCDGGFRQSRGRSEAREPRSCERCLGASLKQTWVCECCQQLFQRGWCHCGNCAHYHHRRRDGKHRNRNRLGCDHGHCCWHWRRICGDRDQRRHALFDIQRRQMRVHVCVQRVRQVLQVHQELLWQDQTVSVLLLHQEESTRRACGGR